jgi:nitrite reductase/ring-hydroxylating ferredoxin subunit
MRFLALDKLINLHDGYRKRVKVDHLDLLLLQEAGEVHVIASRCPHQEHSLEQGDIQDGTIYCPTHGYGFSLTNGRHEGGTCDSLRIYPVVYEGASVGITLPE